MVMHGRHVLRIVIVTIMEGVVVTRLAMLSSVMVLLLNWDMMYLVQIQEIGQEQTSYHVEYCKIKNQFCVLI